MKSNYVISYENWANHDATVIEHSIPDNGGKIQKSVVHTYHFLFDNSI